MTLTDLRYIAVLAELRHFGRAAERCHVAQPTLSAAVKKLEDELGVTLFERSPADVRITPVGEAVVEQARRVLAEAARVKELAQSGRDALVGALRLGAIYTVGPYLLPSLIPIVHARAPAMPLMIEENYTARLVESLKAGALDAIVIALPFAEIGLVARGVYDEPLRVVVPAQHRWAQRSEIRPAELAEEPMLLLGAGNCFRDQVLEVCPRLREAEPNGRARAMEGSSLETIRHMVASGMGITVLPSSCADPLAHTNPLIRVLPFAALQPTRRIALVWRTSFPRIAAVDVLLRAIEDCALPGSCCPTSPDSAINAAGGGTCSA
ncbi:MAG: LysR family transcriptional regulator [Rhodocyclaceae bacterium]|nr:LysR family transcriptional regulator [Rhodocyclaceae bacterium]MBX3669544.1 LysR family transcriptional regulator [Rhodocyclaceae bacterium]